jgi:hypothetical protein
LNVMIEYQKYIDDLNDLLYEVYETGIDGCLKNKINLHLNGVANKTLRELITEKKQKEASAYFTGHELANRLSLTVSNQVKGGAVFFDPACGAGDLLISCARYLPIKQTFEETLNFWSKQIKGFDLHEEFVLATKYRLALLAVEKGARPENEIDIKNYFWNIKVQDALSNIDWPNFDICITNPPFSCKNTNSVVLDWASGSVTQASLFIQRAIQQSEGKIILAILPDVLRSGSSYLRWRKKVEQYCNIENVNIIGRFDEIANVDVFTCELVSKKENVNKNYNPSFWHANDHPNPSDGKCIEDFFEVKVGPVVPHRDPLDGHERTYLESKNAPPWTCINVDFKTETRKFSGSCFTPPFVVVRRTSSPKDKKRIKATLICGKQPVAIENHLIILKPLNSKYSIELCNELIQKLYSPLVDEWLNKRIRCRHLTVTSVKEIPWKLV